MVRRTNESGQTLVFVALAMPVLLGFLGLGIDMGYLRYVKRQVQMAADAAALAGALEINQGDVASAAQASVSTDNSFPNVTQSTGCTATPGTGATVVLVNNPPTCLSTDPQKGNSSYVEVYVFRNVPTLFAKILGFNSAIVGARGEAGLGNSNNCFYVLGPTGTTVSMPSGSVTLQMPSCNMFIDSSGSSALNIGGTNSITAASIQIVGGYTKGGSATLNPTPTTGIKSVSDPLSYLTKPTVGSTCNRTNYATGSGSGTVTLSQGTYCGGITISNGWSVKFSPGMYILNGGGLKISGSGTTSSLTTGGDGSGGVTFFLTANSTYTYKPVNIANGVTVSLTAPTSGTYAGVLFFQDSSAPGATSASVNTFGGGSTDNFQGALYFPTTTVQYTNSSSSQYAMVVAYDLTVSGSAYVKNNWPSGVSPIKGATALLGE